MTYQLLANHVHHGWGPGPWIGLVWLAIWGMVIFFAVTRWRRRGPWRSGHSGESVLAERYARGEIDADEYRTRLATLKEDGR
jgi:putative membrane protein